MTKKKEYSHLMGSHTLAVKIFSVYSSTIISKGEKRKTEGEITTTAK